MKFDDQGQYQYQPADDQCQESRGSITDIEFAKIQPAGPASVSEGGYVPKKGFLAALGAESKKGSGENFRLPF